MFRVLRFGGCAQRLFLDTRVAASLGDTGIANPACRGDR